MFGVRAALPCCRSLVTIGPNSFKRLTSAKSFCNQQYLSSGASKSQLTLVAQQQRLYASSTTNATPNDSGDIRIYYGSLAPRMKAVRVFSLTTSLAGLAAQPVLLEHGMKLGGTPMAVFFCSFAGFFTFVTPLLLHFITKKYVTEIHYNPNTNEYTATTISFLLYKIQTKFRPTDVKVPEVPGMFTSFFVRDKALFVDPALFEDPEHYVRIMGYDKPVDFKLDLSQSASKADEAIKKK